MGPSRAFCLPRPFAVLPRAGLGGGEGEDSGCGEGEWRLEGGEDRVELSDHAAGEDIPAALKKVGVKFSGLAIASNGLRVSDAGVKSHDENQLSVWAGSQSKAPKNGNGIRDRSANFVRSHGRLDRYDLSSRQRRLRGFK